MGDSERKRVEADLSSTDDTVREEAEKREKEDLKYRINAVEAGKDLKDAMKAGGADMEKNIEKAFSKFDPKVVANFSDEQLREFGRHATSSQDRAINRAGKEEKLELIKNSK